MHTSRLATIRPFMKYFFIRTFQLELFSTLYADFNKLVELDTFLTICQRDDVIRALDQASGISFDARTKRLSYSSHNSPYEQGREIHTSSVLTGFEVVNSRYGASLSTRLDGGRTQQDVMNILSGCKKGFENDF